MYFQLTQVEYFFGEHRHANFLICIITVSAEFKPNDVQIDIFCDRPALLHELKKVMNRGFVVLLLTLSIIF